MSFFSISRVDAFLGCNVLDSYVGYNCFNAGTGRFGVAHMGPVQWPPI